MQQTYLIKLLERIAYQTSGTRLEFKDYLDQVVKRPRIMRKRYRKVGRELVDQPPVTTVAQS